MHVRMFRGPICTAAVITGLLVSAGCVRVVSDEEGKPAIPATTITVVAINQTGKPLDPQIFVAPAADGAEALFAAKNKRSDFGVGGLGILLPDSEIALSVKCGEGVLIGTQGGIFGDDLTEPDGSGQQFVLEEDLNVHCGDMLAFVYSAHASTLVTTYTVQPQLD